MTSIYDLMTPHRGTSQPRPAHHLIADEVMDHSSAWLARARSEVDASAGLGQIQTTAVSRHSQRMLATHAARGDASARDATALLAALRDGQDNGTLAADWAAYLRDAAERAVLCADILRQRGDQFLEHEAAGCPPVLIYDYEKVMDGRDLPHPSNYELLRILPPPGVSLDDTRRPYVIIDPRAGHGPGIGGFKPDSQVGVALRAGHPVYFVSFRQRPEPGQYIAFVTRTQAAFVRAVMRRHPDAPRPIVIGNCQGGWATLLLAATNPDLTGPIVVNGAPVAPWSGKVGQDPMRYLGGLNGGAWVPMLLSDLGGGLFDGAHLVQNFELLNPSRTLFRKYTDLFRDADTAAARFLEFEKWWGGFFLMTEPEIRWIVEQIFIGNRLVKNEARIEPGRPVDLKAIRAPIIVFASHGDNITPPQQALNWITETYTDVNEIRIRGQRIIYMVHPQVGHLGIFVSSQIANKEHTEVASTVKTIEALAPGLYEMIIEDVQQTGGRTHFTVGFAERSFDDIRALDDGIADEQPFAAVARVSEVQSQIYAATLRPLVQAAVTAPMAEAGRALHPQRLRRALMSSRNPLVAPLDQMAQKLRADRHKPAPDNPFLAAEALWVQATEQAIDLWRDWRDFTREVTFFALWSTPFARAFGRTHEAHRTLKDANELRALPEVAHALLKIDQGGFVEGVIRMLVLLAESRGGVRRDRLERSGKVLSLDSPFAELGPEARALIIHEQTLIATYETNRGIEALPRLLPPDQREKAVQVVQFIAGSPDEMEPHTRAMLHRFRSVLDLPPEIRHIATDPLQDTPPAPGPADKG